MGPAEQFKLIKGRPRQLLLRGSVLVLLLVFILDHIYDWHTVISAVVPPLILVCAYLIYRDLKHGSEPPAPIRTVERLSALPAMSRLVIRWRRTTVSTKTL